MTIRLKMGAHFLGVFFLTLFLNFPGYAYDSSGSTFSACKKPSLDLRVRGIQVDDPSLTCSGTLPTLDQMDDFVEKFNRYQRSTLLPDSGIDLLGKVSARVKFLTKLNLKELEQQKRCFQLSEKSPECFEIRQNLRDGIRKNWHDMSLGAVLGLQDNSAVRYQLGAKEPDLFIFGTTKHPFGGKIRIQDDIKKEAQKIFKETSKKFPADAQSGLREHLQETYKEKYVSSLLKAPIMAMLPGPNASDKEIVSALDEMMENNQDMIEKELDPSELAGFKPVIESILEEEPHYCRFADHWMKTVQKNQKTKRYLKMGAAGVSGVGCAVSAWTGVGLSLCFTTGALVTGTGIADSYQNKKLERMKTFTSALDSKLIQDFDKLTEAEQDYALELVLAPLVGFGAGKVFKSTLPNAKTLSWVNRVKSSAKPPTPAVTATKSSTMTSLEKDMKAVRDRYKTISDDMDLQVCGMNIGDSMCKSNIKELLRFAKTKYPDFDLSKARVIQIQSEKYVPLYANKASRPSGYSSSVGDVKDYASKARTAKDGSTTWSKHFVMEYEGRIFDFDFAEDTALTTAEYFDKMFSDTLSGVVKDRARSTYLVRTINAQDYLNTPDVRIFEFEFLPGKQEYFFDFYKSLPGSKTNIKAPPIDPRRAQLVAQ